MIHISGSNFIFSESLWCKFGLNVAAASFVSTEEITCIVPPGLVGNVSLSASNNGVDFVSGSLTFRYYESAKAHSIRPKHGKKSGGTPVAIAGTGFENTGSLSCMFGMEVVPGSFISTEEVMCIAPLSLSSSADFVAVEISLNGYDFTTNGVLYEYVDDAAVVSVIPVSGPMSGGSIVTLTGFNFVGSEAPICRFGNKAVEGLLLSLSEIECMTPSMVSFELCVWKCHFHLFWLQFVHSIFSLSFLVAFMCRIDGFRHFIGYKERDCEREYKWCRLYYRCCFF